MTTTIDQAAALDAAAVRAVLLDVEDAIVRELRSARRIEDAHPGELRLPECHGHTMPGGLWLMLGRASVTVTGPGVKGEELLAWSAPRAIDAVIENRAGDPVAAHGRDLQRADYLVAYWRRDYEREHARLRENGPRVPYGHPEGPIYGAQVGGYEPFCPLLQREMYSRLLARAIDSRQRLAEAGPAWPDQPSLF